MSNSVRAEKVRWQRRKVAIWRGPASSRIAGKRKMMAAFHSLVRFRHFVSIFTRTQARISFIGVRNTYEIPPVPRYDHRQLYRTTLGWATECQPKASTYFYSAWVRQLNVVFLMAINRLSFHLRVTHELKRITLR